MATVFKYFKVHLRLIRPQLGTHAKASIWDQHVLQKAKKEIHRANSLSGKLSKSLEKYVGVEISESKEIKELQGILRAFMEITGIKKQLPEDVKSLVEFSVELEKEILEAEHQDPANVFLRDENGRIIIGSHMILGNIKENARIIVNGGDKTFIKSKVAVGEMGALDLKCVDDTLMPTFNGKPISKAEQIYDQIKDMQIPLGKILPPDGEGGLPILERPISFDRMGKRETAIARSELIPAGSEYVFVLRTRDGSVFSDQENLEKLLSCGRNNGLGTWRGSGNMGAYVYKIEEIDFEEKFEDGFK